MTRCLKWLSVVMALLVVLVIGGLAQLPVAGKRYALLVGINAYEHKNLPKLEWSEADADDMAKVLREANYEVTLMTGSVADRDLLPTKANIEVKLKAVLRGCKAGDTVVVAFAGHGIQFEKFKPTDPEDAYFCPSDARPFRDERETMVSLTTVYAELEKSFAGVKVLLVDACRNDPDASRGRSAGITSGSVKPPEGVAALFSCRAGERAFEHKNLKHGVFFHHVLEGLKGEAKGRKGQVTFTSLAKYVMDRVPEDVPTLVGGGARQSPNMKADLSNDPVLLTLGDGTHATGDEKTYVSKATGMKFVRIPKGTFTMGSQREVEEDSVMNLYTDKIQLKLINDSHEVTLTKDYYLGVYEVTQKEWFSVMGTTPWSGKEKEGDDYPATHVSWEDAVTYAKKLSEKDGREYRLPTEAEWEYACRGGSKSKFNFGDDENSLKDHGWYFGNSFNGPREYGAHPVGLKRANGFGLYDMHGNADEWCSDWHNEYKIVRAMDPTGPVTGLKRVSRGGGYNYPARECQSADRHLAEPSGRYNSLGFRLALVPPDR